MRLHYMLNDQGYVLDSISLHDDVMRLPMGFRIGMSRDVFNKIVRINTTQDIVVIFNDYQTVRCIFFFKENKLIHIIISPEQYGRSVWWSEILTDIYGVNQGL